SGLSALLEESAYGFARGVEQDDVREIARQLVARCNCGVVKRSSHRSIPTHQDVRGLVENDLEGGRAVVGTRDQNVPPGSTPEDRVGAAPVHGLDDVDGNRQATPGLSVELLQPRRDFLLVGVKPRLERRDPETI